MFRVGFLADRQLYVIPQHSLFMRAFDNLLRGWMAAGMVSAGAILSVTAAQAATIAPYDTDFTRLEAENGTLAGGATAATTESDYSGSGYVLIDAAGQSISWSNVVLQPGLYHVSLGFKSQFGTEGQNKVVNVAINGSNSAVTLPNDTYFSSVFLGDIQMGSSNTVSISDNWTHFEIDYIQFVRVEDEAENDKGATRAAHLVDYLVANAGKSIVSGQQSSDDVDYILTKTGVAPAIICEDLDYYDSASLDNGGNPSQTTENLIKRAEQGYLISACWHWHSPSGYVVNNGDDYWWNSFYSEHTSFDVAAAMADPSSADYQLLLADIDLMAVELQKLADANVPVLWRPLHEAEGNVYGAWFWWGDGGSDVFKQLWQLMYDRLENYHGLHNLIWVYTCTDLMQTSWYPGDDYVDIIGYDGYPSDRTTTLKTSWDTLVARFNNRKPYALSEFGGVPQTDAMLAAGVNWLYFSSWNGDTNGPASLDDASLSAIYTAAGTMTLGEMDQNQDGFTNDAALQLGFSLQTKLMLDVGIDLGTEVGQLGLLKRDDFTFDISLGNIVELNPSQALTLGSGFTLQTSSDLNSWTVPTLSASQFQMGEDDTAVVVFPTSTSPQFFRVRYNKD